jgi:hypothetical protein
MLYNDAPSPKSQNLQGHLYTCHNPVTDHTALRCAWSNQCSIQQALWTCKDSPYCTGRNPVTNRTASLYDGSNLHITQHALSHKDARLSLHWPQSSDRPHSTAPCSEAAVHCTPAHPKTKQSRLYMPQLGIVSQALTLCETHAWMLCTDALFKQQN